MRESAAGDCQTVQQDVVSLLDGELRGLRSDEVRAHFGVCPPCERFYSALRQQLVLHEWARAAPFDLNEADLCVPEDVPDYGALAHRVRSADVGQVGRLLYEILKAEFLFDYGDGVEAASEPIDDPRAERRRGAEIVEELRDWHDRDEVQGVDLAGVAQQLQVPGIDADRLAALIRGMEVVARAEPELSSAARYYQGLAHMKARHEADAGAIFAELAAQDSSPLARPAAVTLATLPLLMGRPPEEAIEGLRACLAGDGLDAIVYFNLAKALFLRDEALVGEGARALEQAIGLDPEMVHAQLERPSEAALRRAAGATAPRR
jgi:hypothetical protein